MGVRERQCWSYSTNAQTVPRSEFGRGAHQGDVCRDKQFEPTRTRKCEQTSCRRIRILHTEGSHKQTVGDRRTRAVTTEHQSGGGHKGMGSAICQPPDTLPLACRMQMYRVFGIVWGRVMGAMINCCARHYAEHH